ncbi:YciI family protein [Streptomyces sp. NPDC048430]|uniref:YciI family protein n=1 Tax=Streptomyces sp. NPDC048430 TaxID=3155388 RepID=UPI0034190C98
MPRFMTLLHLAENTDPSFREDVDFQQRMGALLEEITKAGVTLGTARLAPIAQSTRLTWADGRLSATYGPFTETKEVIGGYSIVQVKDKAEAMGWASASWRPPGVSQDHAGRRHGTHGARLPGLSFT